MNSGAFLKQAYLFELIGLEWILLNQLNMKGKKYALVIIDVITKMTQKLGAQVIFHISFPVSRLGGKRKTKQ